MKMPGLMQIDTILDLCTKPGEPNANGIIYDKESYINAIKSFMDINKDGSLVTLTLYDTEDNVTKPYSEIRTISNSAGILYYIDLETRKGYLRTRHPYNNKDWCLTMKYTGEQICGNLYKIEKIDSFQISKRIQKGIDITASRADCFNQPCSKLLINSKR